jgi:hypothetical protein
VAPIETVGGTDRNGTDRNSTDHVHRHAGRGLWRYQTDGVSAVPGDEAIEAGIVQADRILIHEAAVRRSSRLLDEHSGRMRDVVAVQLTRSGDVV